MGRARPGGGSTGFSLKSSRLDREVDHGEESKVEEEVHEEESRSGAQEEKDDEVVEESGAEEEGQEGCTEAQSCRAEAEGGCAQAEGSCAEAKSRGAKARGQPNAGTRACTRAGACTDTGCGCGYAAGVRRYWQRWYELVLAQSETRRVAIEPSPRQTQRSRIVACVSFGRIA
jgi:hypothetical protein